MFQVEIIGEDALPDGVDYAVVVATNGDRYGLVKASRLHRTGMPPPLQAGLVRNSERPDATG